MGRGGSRMGQRGRLGCSVALADSMRALSLRGLFRDAPIFRNGLSFILLHEPNNKYSYLGKGNKLE